MKIIFNPLTGLPNIASTKWGDIRGNIEDQTDLINFIGNNQLYEVTMVDGYYSKWNRLYETSVDNPEEKTYLSGVY